MIQLLTEVAEVAGGYNEYFVQGMGAIAAAIAILAGLTPGLSEGLAAKGAVEGVARNPEAAGQIKNMLMVGCALSETTAIYGLLVSMLLLFLVAMR